MRLGEKRGNVKEDVSLQRREANDQKAPQMEEAKRQTREKREERMGRGEGRLNCQSGKERGAGGSGVQVTLLHT